MRELKRVALRMLATLAVAMTMAIIYPAQSAEAACSHVGTTGEVTPARCDRNGKEIIICSKCGIKLYELTIPAYGHDMMEPTCTAPWTCRTCGVTSGTSLGHSYKAATCVSVKSCTRCGHVGGGTLPHNYMDATCMRPTMCVDCHATVGTPLRHSYADATCEKPMTCTRTGCNATSGTALGHSMAEPTCESGWKCRRCGVESGAALWHDFADATCENPITCRRCGLTSGEPLHHILSEGLITVANPTCTSPGRRAVVCKREGCGAEFNGAEIEKLPHTYEGATCTTPGVCTECKAVGHKLAHKYEKKNRGWSCTEWGGEYKECADCGSFVWTDRKYKPMGHDYLEATCDEPETCRACGATRGEPLHHKPLNSRYNYVIVQEATCVDDEIRVLPCQHCGLVLNTQTFPKKPHELPEEFEVIREASCEIDGEEVKECFVCKDVIERNVLPATGHTLIDEIEVSETFYADYSQTGFGILYCKDCGGDLRHPAVRRKMDDPSNIDTQRINTALTHMLKFYNSPERRNYYNSPLQTEQINKITNMIRYDLDFNNTSKESASAVDNCVLHIATETFTKDRPVEEVIEEMIDLAEDLGLDADPHIKAAITFYYAQKTVIYLCNEHQYITQCDNWYTALNESISEEEMREFVRQRMVADGLDEMQEYMVDEIVGTVGDLIKTPELIDIKTIQEAEAYMLKEVWEEQASEKVSFQIGDFSDLYKEQHPENCMFDNEGDKTVKIQIFHGYNEYIRNEQVDLPTTIFNVYFDQNNKIKRVYSISNYISE